MSVEEIKNNLRIATFSIAAFDFLQTIPGECYLYRKQWRNGKLSLICFLFIVVRYVSILALILNGVGFYIHTFNDTTCKAFYYFPMFAKMIAGMASNGIIFCRTYAISHTRKALVCLWALWIIVFPLQILGNTYKRRPVVGKGIEAGNCQAKTLPGDFNSAPYYYLANLIFDTVACTIASVSLLPQGSIHGNLGRIRKKVLKHGLLYAFASTLTNFLVTLALFGVAGLSILGSFLSIGVTMILAQHLVLATAGIHKTAASEDGDGTGSSGETRERSLSRDVKNRQIVTIGGTAMNISTGGNRDRHTSMAARSHGIGSLVEHIELGGIRVEREIHRDVDIESMELNDPKGNTHISEYSRKEAVNLAVTNSAGTSVENFYEANDEKKRAGGGGSIV